MTNPTERAKALRENIREMYRLIMNNDPPFKEEIDFGVKCYIAGFAAARVDAERVLVAELQAINVQAIVNSQEGQLEVTERINAALVRWKENGE